MQYGGRKQARCDHDDDDNDNNDDDDDDVEHDDNQVDCTRRRLTRAWFGMTHRASRELAQLGNQSGEQLDTESISAGSLEALPHNADEGAARLHGGALHLGGSSFWPPTERNISNRLEMAPNRTRKQTINNELGQK